MSKYLITAIALVALTTTVLGADRVKLTGEELRERYSQYRVSAGISHRDGRNWMVVVYTDGTRDLYWNIGGNFGVDTGTHRVVGDQVCITWKKAFGGREKCYAIYRIDESRYSVWFDGELEHTSFQIRPMTRE